MPTLQLCRQSFHPRRATFCVTVYSAMQRTAKVDNAQVSLPPTPNVCSVVGIKFFLNHPCISSKHVTPTQSEQACGSVQDDDFQVHHDQDYTPRPPATDEKHIAGGIVEKVHNSDDMLLQGTEMLFWVYEELFASILRTSGVNIDPVFVPEKLSSAPDSPPPEKHSWLQQKDLIPPPLVITQQPPAKLSQRSSPIGSVAPRSSSPFTPRSSGDDVSDSSFMFSPRTLAKNAPGNHLLPEPSVRFSAGRHLKYVSSRSNEDSLFRRRSASVPNLMDGLENGRNSKSGSLSARAIVQTHGSDDNSDKQARRRRALQRRRWEERRAQQTDPEQQAMDDIAEIGDSDVSGTEHEKDEERRRRRVARLRRHRRSSKGSATPPMQGKHALKSSEESAEIIGRILKDAPRHLATIFSIASEIANSGSAAQNLTECTRPMCPEPSRSSDGLPRSPRHGLLRVDECRRSAAFGTDSTTKSAVHAEGMKIVELNCDTISLLIFSQQVRTEATIKIAWYCCLKLGAVSSQDWAQQTAARPSRLLVLDEEFAVSIVVIRPMTGTVGVEKTKPKYLSLGHGMNPAHRTMTKMFLGMALPSFYGLVVTPVINLAVPLEQ